MKHESFKSAQFTSDWHLSPHTPRLTRAFTYWLENAQHCVLYILGDLFDFWVGDDQLAMEYYANIALSLKNCACPVFIMRGNRDFLLGNTFEKEAEISFLPDPFLLTFHNERLLLSHGDQYCTHDLAYMEFFKKTRNPMWQKEVLNQSFAERMALAQHLREQSEKTQNGQYSDLNPLAIEKLLSEIPCDVFIHGHTHQKGIHQHGKTTRFVLPNWEENAQGALPEILIAHAEESSKGLHFSRIFDPSLF